MTNSLVFRILSPAFILACTSGCGAGGGEDEQTEEKDPNLRRCGDFLTLAEAESVGVEDYDTFPYDENSEESDPGFGVLCAVGSVTLSIFVGAQYDTLRGGAEETNLYGQRSFGNPYAQAGSPSVGVLTENGKYSFILAADEAVFDDIIEIILRNAEAL